MFWKTNKTTKRLSNQPLWYIQLQLTYMLLKNRNTLLYRFFFYYKNTETNHPSSHCWLISVQQLSLPELQTSIQALPTLAERKAAGSKVHVSSKSYKFQWSSIYYFQCSVILMLSKYIKKITLSLISSMSNSFLFSVSPLKNAFYPQVHMNQ